MRKTNTLVSIPPIAKVTDIGAIDQMRAVATPALRFPKFSPKRMRRRVVPTSARVFISSAIQGNGASTPPETIPKRVIKNEKIGVVVPRTLSPGLYCISGNVRVNNAGDSFYGDGVTLYFLDGSLTINGGTVQISAPSRVPDPDPAIAGMLILFAPGNSNDIKLNGNSDSYFKGTILAPESDIDMLGNGSTNGYQSQVIGFNVEVGGTADTYVFYDDNNNYSRPSSNP